MIELLIATLIVSLSVNAYLSVQLHKKKSRPESAELQDFLVDLMSGSALVKVSRVDTADMVLRQRR